jgi:hypothetical protein
MTFNSPDFAIFFAVVLLLCRLWPGGRGPILLVASFVFYSWLSWQFGIILFLMSIAGYVGASAVARMQSNSAKRFALAATISLILSPLLILKYWDFAVRSIEEALAGAGVAVTLFHINRAIPPGIRDRRTYGRADEIFKQIEARGGISGPAGMAYIANTQFCLHRAGVPEPGLHRDLLQVQVISAPTVDLTHAPIEQFGWIDRFHFA